MAALDWLPAGSVHVLAWTLLHSLWQFGLVALAVAALLPWLGRQDARARHGLCLVGLVLMALLPLLTFGLLTSRGAGQASLPLADALTRDGVAPGLGPAGSGAPLWTSWLAGLWALGAAVCLARTARCWRRDRLLSRSAREPAPAWLQHTCDQLCRDFGLGRGVRLALSSVASVPSVVGWAAPVVLLPIAAVDALRPDQLRAVLAHELAHVARHDALVNLFQACLEALFFFHPAVWWLSGRLRTEREFCCDDLAVAASGDALVFARALSTLDALAALPTPRAALSSQGGPLMDRISRLLGRTEHPPTGRLAGATLGLVMLGAVSTSAAVLTDEDCLSSVLTIHDGRVELSLDDCASDCTLVLSRSGGQVSVVCAAHPEQHARVQRGQAAAPQRFVVRSNDGTAKQLQLAPIDEGAGDGGALRFRSAPHADGPHTVDLHVPGADGPRRLRVLGDLDLKGLGTKLRALHLPEVDEALQGLDLAELETSLEALDIEALIGKARESADGSVSVLHSGDGDSPRFELKRLPKGGTYTLQLHDDHDDAPHARHPAHDDGSLPARLRAVLDETLGQHRVRVGPGDHDVHQGQHTISVPGSDGHDLRLELRGLPSGDAGTLLKIAPRVQQHGDTIVLDLKPQVDEGSQRTRVRAPGAVSRYRVLPLLDGQGSVVLDLLDADDDGAAPQACDGGHCCQHGDDDSVSALAPRPEHGSSPSSLRESILGGLLRSALSLIDGDDGPVSVTTNTQAPATQIRRSLLLDRRVPAPAVIGRRSVVGTVAPVVSGRRTVVGTLAPTSLNTCTTLAPTQVSTGTCLIEVAPVQAEAAREDEVEPCDTPCEAPEAPEAPPSSEAVEAVLAT